MSIITQQLKQNDGFLQHYYDTEDVNPENISKYTFERQVVAQVRAGFKRRKRLMHIIAGPRQIGKSVASLQIAAKWQGPVVIASADQPVPPGPEWIHTHWELAILKARESSSGSPSKVLLILDEIQKVPGWSEVIKGLWDKEQWQEHHIELILLGSSTLLLQKGMTESLAGRFYLYRCMHWSLAEMHEAFGWDLENWLFYGGYPGAAPLVSDSSEDHNIWVNYVRDSLIETVIAKDVLQLQTVAKPALLRHLFLLACSHPAQILSYNKMLGQLHDAGNTTTLAHYLKLLESAYLLSGLELFKFGKLTKRGSSPKLILWNNGLINAVVGETFTSCRTDFSWWGRIVENAVGAHLLNHLSALSCSIYYWRERGNEVDFVIKTPKQLWAIEVKSSPARSSDAQGLAAFCGKYPEARPLVIGNQGMGLEDFFLSDPENLFL